MAARAVPIAEDSRARPRLGAADEARLAGLPLLVTFTLVLGGLLAIVFPTGREYAELADVKTPDAYSIAYLSVLVRASPEDVDLRMLYVRHLTLLGRYDDALVVIEPAVADPRVGLEARNMRLDLLLAKGRSYAAGDRRRELTLQRAAEEVAALSAVPESAERLKVLADLALQFDDPRLAAESFAKAADADPASRVELLAKAGRWMRAAGDGERAAYYYGRAADLAASPAEARENALLAIASLESADKVEFASDLASTYTQRFWTDAGMVERAIELAMACTRAKEARRLGRRLLELVPQTDERLRAQMDRELGAGDPAAALVITRRLVAEHPDDPDLRATEAHVAEWAGDPETALTDWMWLLNRRPAPQAPPPADPQP